MQEVIYEPHPVTPERVKELEDQGYLIVDARFDPNPKNTDKPEHKKGK